MMAQEASCFHSKTISKQMVCHKYFDRTFPKKIIVIWCTLKGGKLYRCFARYPVERKRDILAWISFYIRCRDGVHRNCSSTILSKCMQYARRCRSGPYQHYYVVQMAFTGWHRTRESRKWDSDFSHSKIHRRLKTSKSCFSVVSKLLSRVPNVEVLPRKDYLMPTGIDTSDGVEFSLLSTQWLESSRLFSYLSARIKTFQQI